MAEPTSPVARTAAAVALLPADHPLRPTAEMLQRYCEDLEAVLAQSPLRPTEPYNVAPEVLSEFAAEVADVRAELAEVAPRMLAVAERYVALRDRFNEEIVPREVARLSDEPAERYWAETGAKQLGDRFYDLAHQMAAAAELRLW